MKEMLYAVRCLKSNEDMILTGKHEPNKLTCSPLCDFIAQLVRALHRRRRGHGFESRISSFDFKHRTAYNISFTVTIGHLSLYAYQHICEHGKNIV